MTGAAHALRPVDNNELNVMESESTVVAGTPPPSMPRGYRRAGATNDERRHKILALAISLIKMPGLCRASAVAAVTELASMSDYTTRRQCVSLRR